MGTGSGFVPFSYKPPAIGEMRHRVTIQTLTETSDGQGGQTQSWATLATVWGKLEPVKASEKAFAQRLQYARSHVLWIRHRTDISMLTGNMNRIQFDSRTWQIKGIRRPDERKFFLILDLDENVGA
jgi:SPP1 family predicted phage head-tail adaptor